jgi:hypothetical protein
MLVLASLDSECAKEVQRLGIGVVVDPKDQLGIEKALSDLVDCSDAYRKSYTSSSLRETWACSCVAGRFGSELAQKLSNLQKYIVLI